MNKAETNRTAIEASYYGITFEFEKAHVPNSAHHTRELICKRQTRELERFLRGQRRLQNTIDWLNPPRVSRLASLVRQDEFGHDWFDRDTLSSWERVLRKNGQAA